VSSDSQLTLADCPAFILVGGFGTRLRSVYDEGPKAMAPINGLPFLGYLLKFLALCGIREVVLCTGYKAELIQQWLGDGTAFGLSVFYSQETEPLGTAGAFRLAYSRHGLNRRFLAMNGDSILQLNLQAMYSGHIAAGCVATMALVSVPDTSRYGTVEVDNTGLVQSFREKGGVHAAGYINGGVYLFEPATMDLVPPRRAVSLERETLPALAAQGLRAFRSDGYFIDIGVPDDFARAQTELKGLGYWP